MIKYETIPATKEHVIELAPHTREGDREELWSSLRMEPEEGLIRALEGSFDAEAVMADGKLMCVYGVSQTSIMSDVGFPWLITHRDIKKHLRPLMAGTKKHLDKLRKSFDILENHVDARNTSEIRWMKWMGFYIHSTEVHGADQLPYHTFRLGDM